MVICLRLHNKGFSVFTCIFSVKYVMYRLITLYDHSEHLMHINIIGSSICSNDTEIALPIKRV